MRDLSRSEAVLIAVWTETLLYGIYVPLFVACLWVTWSRKLRVNWKLFAPAIVMFMLSTIHMGGFILSPIPSDFFKDYHTWIYHADLALYVTIALVGDSVVIYRAYAIWDSKFSVVAAPIAMLIASTTSGYYAVAGVNTIQSGQTANIPRVSDFLRTEMILSLALNLTCTSLIAFRIGSSARVVAPLSRSRMSAYYGVLAIIIESAAIYTVSVAIFIGCYLAEIGAQTILFNMNVQIMCIVQALILVRVGMGLHHDDTTLWQTTRSPGGVLDIQRDQGIIGDDTWAKLQATSWTGHCDELHELSPTSPPAHGHSGRVPGFEKAGTGQPDVC
ncbi:hypothetical protein BOTBODRAFT_172306 [Botryobasidium botryosum FD-172 SS1]|uniref:Integral membrane protein n=1 Tax=Botryobasidium botryosum (strain FD-172 SS1) TaxID=930990 RepID=A0A067MNW3_BOTB1|nr:hypothetical protein BOTBODRAFT_172306 [Botryobasidium botryosum FD-172 SS1]